MHTTSWYEKSESTTAVWSLCRERESLFPHSLSIYALLHIYRVSRKTANGKMTVLTISIHQRICAMERNANGSSFKSKRKFGLQPLDISGTLRKIHRLYKKWFFWLTLPVALGTFTLHCTAIVQSSWADNKRTLNQPNIHATHTKRFLQTWIHRSPQVLIPR